MFPKLQVYKYGLIYPLEVCKWAVIFRTLMFYQFSMVMKVSVNQFYFPQNLKSEFEEALETGDCNEINITLYCKAGSRLLAYYLRVLASLSFHK